MNKSIKIIGVMFSLLLLTILLLTSLMNTGYLLPFQLERFRFFSVTNYYVQQYVFWGATVFAIITVLVLLVLLFYPKTVSTFLLKKENGELILDKKAIEGMVRSYLHEDEFIHSPKVKIRATKNKIAVIIKGELKRTSSLLSKTGALMNDIEAEIKRTLGTEESVKISVKYTGYQYPERNNNLTQARVE